MSATVEIREHNGTYTAIDNESGAAGTGTTKAMALVALATALGGGDIDPGSPVDELRALSSAAQKRFADAGVSEDDIDEAVEWARSQ